MNTDRKKNYYFEIVAILLLVALYFFLSRRGTNSGQWFARMTGTFFPPDATIVTDKNTYKSPEGGQHTLHFRTTPETARKYIARLPAWGGTWTLGIAPIKSTDDWPTKPVYYSHFTPRNRAVDETGTVWAVDPDSGDVWLLDFDWWKNKK